MAEAVIVAEGLAKRSGDVVALDRIDLAVPRGAILGLPGPNGAGNTTTAGTVSVFAPFAVARYRQTA